MSDLFHEGVPDSYIDQVFAVMALAPHHIFQVLTKRPERMRDYCADFSWSRVIDSCTGADGVSTLSGFTLQALTHHFGQVPLSTLSYKRRDLWPLPNVWLGVSVEDQAAADERIPFLLQTPAAIRWLSMEPLLGPVDLARSCRPWGPGGASAAMLSKINWVVVGGESGPKARPRHPDLARSLRDQCAAAGVPFLFKQWGGWAPTERDGDSLVVHGQSKFADNPQFHNFDDGVTMARIGKKAAGLCVSPSDLWEVFRDPRKVRRDLYSGHAVALNYRESVVDGLKPALRHACQLLQERHGFCGAYFLVLRLGDTLVANSILGVYR